jgi:membrane-associated phospholipid phosphatase
VTSLLFLMARYYRLRRTSIVLAGYVGVTMVATVYLGWHFAVDDVAGLAIALVSVFLGSRMIYPHGGRAAPAREIA